MYIFVKKLFYIRHLFREKIYTESFIAKQNNLQKNPRIHVLV